MLKWKRVGKAFKRRDQLKQKVSRCRREWQINCTRLEFKALGGEWWKQLERCSLGSDYRKVCPALKFGHCPQGRGEDFSFLK